MGVSQGCVMEIPLGRWCRMPTRGPSTTHAAAGASTCSARDDKGEEIASAERHDRATLLHASCYCLVSTSTVLTGKSQWASRIVKRRCSSCWYASWSGNSCFLSASSSKASLATVAFLKTMVTR